MSKINRRRAIVSAGALGLVGLGARAANADDGNESKLPSVLDISSKLKLTDREYEQAGVIATPENAPVVLIPPPAVELKEASLEPQVVEIVDGNDRRLTYALQWTCPTDVINRFTIGEAPFNARRFTFSTRNISWQAGNGWPVYTTYCPRGDFSTSMYYRHAKVHQIVPSIKGQNYFIGCLSSAICESAEAGQVSFAVNDSGDYRDNRGTFTVTITNWS